MNNLADFFKGKKVLVTGHTGFKGSWLMQILLSWGADVVGVSLMPKTSPNLYGILGLQNGANSYYFDIDSHEGLLDVIKKESPEIVFHLAAQPIVRDSYDNPLETYNTNVMGTANVLEAIRKTDSVKSAVIITTDKVYKNDEWVYPYREVDPLGGYDPYSASKAAADITTNSYIQSFFNVSDYKDKHNTLVAIARAGNVIGGGDWGNHRLVTDIVRSIFEKDEKIIIRSPKAIRPWEHVLEPLHGYLMLGKKLYEGETEMVGSWNFGPNDSHFVSVEEIVKKAIEVLGKGEYSVEEDSTKHEANILKLETSKAKCVLKWKSKLTFEDTLKYTFDWYRKYYEGKDNMTEYSNNQIYKFFNLK
ncbi:CDP-glucose 4,6-dehydratase [Patescibacteria group bacterium]